MGAECAAKADRKAFCRTARCTVRNAVKDRFVLAGIVLAPLPFLILSIPWAHAAFDAFLKVRPWAHLTLEACLNVLWLGLVATALLYWPRTGSRRADQLRGLVSLVFALSLLFPIISASDDDAQWAFINDASTAQSAAASLNNDKRLPYLAGLLASQAPVALQFTVFSAFEASTPAQVPSVTAFGDATGNHSPPPC